MLELGSRFEAVATPVFVVDSDFQVILLAIFCSAYNALMAKTSIVHSAKMLREIFISKDQ
jgi:hypothetical protein